MDRDGHCVFRSCFQLSTPARAVIFAEMVLLLPTVGALLLPTVGAQAKLLASAIQESSLQKNLIHSRPEQPLRRYVVTEVFASLPLRRYVVTEVFPPGQGLVGLGLDGMRLTVVALMGFIFIEGRKSLASWGQVYSWPALAPLVLALTISSIVLLQT